MSDYSRPNDEGVRRTTFSFWASLWRPMEGNVHGQAVISPKFATQRDLIAWVGSRKREGDEITQYKRTSYESGSYEDDALLADDPPSERDKARVHALVKDLKAMLDAKRKDLDKGPLKAKPYSRVSEFNPIERPLTYDEIYGEESA